ncbi:MAG: hypothetical protein V4858_04430 [Pseudomonadota bacterium]
MIVPQFWAESRLQHRTKGRQVTVRRFGWSDTSLADAQQSADVRVQQALDRILSGEKLARKDPKIPYNGAAGVPIREEIVDRQGETIITRNSYGARCLNTPHVLFADIDFPEGPPLRFTAAFLLTLLLVSGAAAWLSGSRAIGMGLVVLTLLLGLSLVSPVFRMVQAIAGGAEQAARKRISAYLMQHPDWNLRLYKTPAGLRVAATHRLFHPSEPAVTEFFASIGTDPLYVAMCLNQQCFRARVTAKPWRIGIQSHMRPRPGVWPVAADRLPVRNAWIAAYEAAAKSHAACRFVENMGNGVVHAQAREVLDLHDTLSQARGSLPIA